LTALRLRSPAKVNLGLWVGNRRPDGYHDLVTVIAPIELADTLTIRRAQTGIAVRCDSPEVPSDEQNLAGKAAHAFFASTGIESGCRITIVKRIPVGGGLGGGSSNAATALLGLNRLFGSPLSLPQLRRIGGALGSDVPVFLARGPCVARGRGDRLRRIRLPRLRLLLYFPGHGVSTSWAYAALDRRRAARPGLTPPTLLPRLLSLYLRHNEPERAAPLLANSFEPVVFRRYPKLSRAKSLLLASGADAAALSGSGSTVYGLVMKQDWKDPMAAMACHGFPCLRTSTVPA
jgi:4-diphosphocytidyl-2-C-methyl-D-erythritol kinase